MNDLNLGTNQANVISSSSTSLKLKLVRKSNSTSVIWTYFGFNTDKHGNPIDDWWKANEDRFPKMSKLARKYLCIPATSVASERVFSTSGNIVNAKRSKMMSEYVDILTFLAKNYSTQMTSVCSKFNRVIL